jgi:tetratricopeptide (TPR) repeat protein
MKTSAKNLAAGLLLALPVVACSRNSIEAVNLANEGDQAKSVNLEEAISKYEQAAKLDPDNHRILWKLALAYHKKEDWPHVASTCAKAEEASEKANKGKKTFANYYQEHGYALLQMALKPGGGGSWAEAKTPLTTAIQVDPNLAEAYEELGDVDLHTDDEQGALDSYTKAIQAKPDELQFYAPLADLYLRLNMPEPAGQVLKEGLSFAKEGDKHLFSIHALLGNVYDMKGDVSGAINEFDAAKKACGKCDDHKEAYFLLGSAYYENNPPRKNEAIQNLQSFWRIACKGSGNKKFEDQCAQSQEIVRKLGGSLQ